MFAKRLQINQTWDGSPLASADFIALFFSLDKRQLRCVVEAPFYDDPAPRLPLGQTHGLWEYEVVELFLLGVAGGYLEIELGPHGHYLIYFFSDVRQVERSVLPLQSSSSIGGNRWRGEICVGQGDLPLGICCANAYGVHGCGDDRRFSAAAPVPGVIPNFHQPKVFLPLSGLADWVL